MTRMIRFTRFTRFTRSKLPIAIATTLLLAACSRDSAVVIPPERAHARADSAVAEEQEEPAAALVTAAAGGGAPASLPIAQAQITDRQPAERRGERVVLAEEELPADPAGIVRRVVLVERAGKYPLIRRETMMDPRRPGIPRTVEMVGDHLVLTVDAQADLEAVRAAVTERGYQLKRQLRGTRSVLVGFAPTSHVAMLAAHQELVAIPGVVSSDRDYLVHTQIEPNDPSFSQQWALKNTAQGRMSGLAMADIGAPAAWDRSTGSHAVKVAVIDTGIDLTHPDLVANLWSNPGESGTDAQGRNKAANGVDDDGNGYVDDVRGWNFYGDTNDAADDNFHGTHVAGTIGAAGNNAIGISGVCWNVSLIPVKFLDENGDGYGSDAVEAVAYATTVGAHVINASWGGGFPLEAMAATIGQAGQQGIFFVAAAGNDGYNIDGGPFYPAAYAEANIIAVAATDRSDRLASFSNYGPLTVAIAAPGSRVLSTMPQVVTPGMLRSGYATGYGELSGTSMAAPHVSGALALLKAADLGASPEHLRATMLARADRLAGLIGYVSGGARLDVGAMLAPAWSDIARVSLADAALTDPAGNRDNQPNPGETIEILFTAGNQGDALARNVTISYGTSTSGVTVLAGSATVADLAPGVRALADASIRLGLGGGLADGARVDGTVTMSWTGGSVSIPHSFAVVGNLPQATRIVPFKTATPVADPVRNRVYVADLNTPSVLAIDTDTGQLVGRLLLDEGGIATGATRNVHLAVALDGSRLAVAQPGMIKQFALPGFALLRTTSLASASATCLAYGVGNSLCFTTDIGAVHIVHPATGVITPIPFLEGSSAYPSGYIYASADGTRLWYVDSQMISPMPVHEFALDGQPRHLRSSSPTGAKGAAVHDPTTDRLLIGYGTVVAMDLVAAHMPYDFWEVPRHERSGNSLALVSGDPYLYSAWGSDVWGDYGERGMERQGIARLRRSDGAYSGSIPTPTGWEIPGRSLAQTANRRLFYNKVSDLTFSDGSQLKSSLLGLVGSTVLEVERYPLARFTATSTAATPRVVSFNAGPSQSRSGQPLTSYLWDFGDATSGTGATPSHTYAVNGTYSVTLTVQDGAGLPDRSSRTVIVNGAAVPATPVAHDAVYTVAGGGQVAITLTGAGGSTFAIATPPQRGTISGTPPTLIYSLPSLESVHEADGFTFTVANGSQVSAPGRITLLLTDEPIAPVAENQSVTVSSGVASPITLRATYRGVVHEQMRIITGPAHGRLTGSPPNVVYQSHDQYVGSDSFTFSSFEQDRWSAPATVSLSVVGGYAFVDLGENVFPTDINDQGVVVGYQVDPSTYRNTAFTWQNGVFTYLPILSGGRNTKALAINNQGVVVGTSGTTIYDHAVRWQNGQITDLGDTPEHYSTALDISDQGVVVGMFDNRACRWIGTSRQLLDYPGWNQYTGSQARAVNFSGVIGGGGQSTLQPGNRAFRWSETLVGSDVTPAGSLPPAEIIAVLNDGTLICNTGNNGERIYRIVGASASPVGDGIALGANQQGDVVGYARIDYQAVAHLWRGGSAINLNSLAPAPNRDLTMARAINGSGAIVGSFDAWVGEHGYLLRPNVNRIPVITSGPTGPSVVTTATATLSVTASDPDASPQALSYDWSVISGPGTVAFTPDATPAAQNTTAAFSVAGDYRILVTVSDGVAFAQQEMALTVDASLAAIQVRPAIASANVGDRLQFTHLPTDQFGRPLRQMLPLTWSVGGGGTIDGTGRFQATSVGGPFVLSAIRGAVQGTASVRVAAALPAPWLHADFGNARTPGWATYSAGEFAIHGDTDLMLGNYHGVYQSRTGDAGLTVRLVAQQGQGWPLLFIRDAEAVSVNKRQASLVFFAGYDDLQLSTAPLPEAGIPGTSAPYAAITLPCWLHLERRGNEILAGYSQDGQTWTACGRISYPISSRILIGMGHIGGVDHLADQSRFAQAMVGDARPVAQAWTGSVPANGQTAIALSGRSNAGLALTYRIVAGPSNGSLSGTAPALTYRPTPGFSGVDGFSYVVNDGISDSAPASVAITVTPVLPAAFKPGLLAQFFDYTSGLSLIPDLSGRTADVTRTDTQIAYASVSTAWSGLPTTMVDTFASRHSGWLKVDTAGAYTLFVSSDDGSRVYLDGASLIDNDGLHGMQERSATVTLATGYHHLRVEFFENGGGAGLELRWQGPGIAKQLVPASALWQEDPAPPYVAGLLAEFFDFTTALSVIPDLTGRSPEVSRTDAQIAYASVSTAWSGLPTGMVDTFASRHSGWLKIDTAGSYTLFVSSDDGSRVYLDGAQVIDNDGLHGMQERSATVTLAAGYHPLRVEFFENGGGAGLQLSWSGPGIAKQLVPTSALWRLPAVVAGLPAPWVSADVGAVGLAGSATGDGDDFTILGSGADIWNNADAFHFVHRPLPGDGELIARVVSLGNTNAWAKAGVMVRASATADSVHAMMVITPANGAAFQYRTVTAAASSSAGSSGRAAPHWVRIVRTGGNVSGWVSSDGVAWTQVGTTVVLSLGTTPLVGLAVTAHDNAQRTTAVFDQVVWIPAAGG